MTAAIAISGCTSAPVNRTAQSGKSDRKIANLEGKEGGNGGNVYFCAAQTPKVQLIDFTEMELLPRITGKIAIPSSTASPDDQINAAVAKISAIRGSTGKLVYDTIQAIRTVATPTPSTYERAVSPDLSSYPIPNGCIPKNAVTYFNAKYVEQNGEMIKEMDNTGIAGLWVHEAVFKILRDNQFGSDDSTLARRITALIFAEPSETTTKLLDYAVRMVLGNDLKSMKNSSIRQYTLRANEETVPLKFGVSNVVIEKYTTMLTLTQTYGDQNLGAPSSFKYGPPAFIKADTQFSKKDRSSWRYHNFTIDLPSLVLHPGDQVKIDLAGLGDPPVGAEVMTTQGDLYLKDDGYSFSEASNRDDRGGLTVLVIRFSDLNTVKTFDDFVQNSKL